MWSEALCQIVLLSACLCACSGRGILWLTCHWLLVLHLCGYFSDSYYCCYSFSHSRMWMFIVVRHRLVIELNSDAFSWFNLLSLWLQLICFWLNVVKYLVTFVNSTELISCVSWSGKPSLSTPSVIFFAWRNVKNFLLSLWEMETSCSMICCVSTRYH